MNPSANSPVHLQFLRLALIEAGKCVPTASAFSVGCVITTRLPSRPHSPVILSAGYSRELPGNTHAEANSLTKARSLSPATLSAMFQASDLISIESLLTNADVYTTLEPCSVRKSGLATCADALVSSGIKRCFIGTKEPGDFVKCEGAQKLRDAGIEVFWLDELKDECLRIARHGHPPFEHKAVSDTPSHNRSPSPS